MRVADSFNTCSPSNRYKDSRSGARIKFAHSLRYQCAQRSDNDSNKRRSAANTNKRRSGEEAQAIDSSKATADFNAATIAAIVAASHQPDDEVEASSGSALDLSNFASAGLGMAGLHIPSAANLDDDPVGSPGLDGEQEDEEDQQMRIVKRRSQQRKMERYDCKGALIVNLHHDDSTVSFTLTHSLRHPEYVDVVGNRNRGTKFRPVAVDLRTSLKPPVGSIDVGGKDPFEKAEKTFAAMLEIVKQLRQTHARAEKGGKDGGEEWVVQELFEKTEEIRKFRVSISEALSKSGFCKARKRRRGTKEDGDEDSDDEDGQARYEDHHDAPRHQPLQLELPDGMLDAGQRASLALSLGLNPSDVGIEINQDSEDADMSSVIARYLDNQLHSANVVGLGGDEGAWALDPLLE